MTLQGMESMVTIQTDQNKGEYYEMERLDDDVDQKGEGDNLQAATEEQEELIPNGLPSAGTTQEDLNRIEQESKETTSPNHPESFVTSEEENHFIEGEMGLNKKDLEGQLLTARTEMEKLNSDALSLRSENDMLRILLSSIEKNQGQMVSGAPAGGLCFIPKLELGSIADESISKQKMAEVNGVGGAKKHSDFPDDATECDFEEYGDFEEGYTGNGSPDRMLSRRHSIHKLSISERTTAKATIYYLQSHLKSKEEDMKKLQNQIQDMDYEADCLRRQVEQLIKKNKDMQTEFLDTMHDNFQHQINELSDENARLQSQLQSTIEEMKKEPEPVPDSPNIQQEEPCIEKTSSFVKKLWDSLVRKNQDTTAIINFFQEEYKELFGAEDVVPENFEENAEQEKSTSLKGHPTKMDANPTDDEMDGSEMGRDDDTIKSESTSFSLLNHENALLLQKTKTQENEIMALRLKVENLEKDKQTLSQHTDTVFTHEEKESMEQEIGVLRGQVALLERNNKVFSNEERKELKQELERTKRRVSNLNEQLMIIRESTEYEEVEKMKHEIDIQAKKIRALESEKAHYRKMCEGDMSEMLEEKEEIIKDRDVLIDELQHRLTSLTIHHKDQVENTETITNHRIEQMKSELEDLRTLLKSKNKIIREKQLALIRMQQLTAPRINISKPSGSITDRSKADEGNTENQHSSAPTSPTAKRSPPQRFRTSSLSRVKKRPGSLPPKRSGVTSRSYQDMVDHDSTSCSDSDARAIKVMSSRMREDIEEAKQKLRDMGRALDAPQHAPQVHIPQKETVPFKYSDKTPEKQEELVVPRIKMPLGERRRPEHQVKSVSAKSFRSAEKEEQKQGRNGWPAVEGRLNRSYHFDGGKMVPPDERISSDTPDGELNSQQLSSDSTEETDTEEIEKEQQQLQTNKVKKEKIPVHEKEQKVQSKKRKDSSKNVKERNDISRVSVADLLGKYAMLQVRSLDHEILQVENECMRKDFLQFKETIKWSVKKNGEKEPEPLSEDKAVNVHDAFRYISTNFSSLLEKKHQAETEIQKLKSQVSQMQRSGTDHSQGVVSVESTETSNNEKQSPAALKPKVAGHNEYLASVRPLVAPKLLDYLRPSEELGHHEINDLRSCLYRVYVAKSDFTPNSSQASLTSSKNSTHNIFPTLSLRSGDIVISIGAPERREKGVMFQLAEVRGRIGFVPLSHLQSAEQVYELKDFLPPQTRARNILSSKSPDKITSMYDKLKKNRTWKYEKNSSSVPSFPPGTQMNKHDDKIAEIFLKHKSRKRKVLSPKSPSSRRSESSEKSTRKALKEERRSSRKERRVRGTADRKFEKRPERSVENSDEKSFTGSDSGIVHTKTETSDLTPSEVRCNGEVTSDYIGDGLYFASPEPPTNLRVEKVFGRRSLILRWTPPVMDAAGRSNGTPVIGYDIHTGRKSKIQISGRHTNKAVVGELDLKMPCTLHIRTVSAKGITSEPASFHFTSE